MVVVAVVVVVVVLVVVVVVVVQVVVVAVVVVVGSAHCVCVETSVSMPQMFWSGKNPIVSKRGPTHTSFRFGSEGHVPHATSLRPFESWKPTSSNIPNSSPILRGWPVQEESKETVCENTCVGFVLLRRPSSPPWHMQPASSLKRAGSFAAATSSAQPAFPTAIVTPSYGCLT